MKLCKNYWHIFVFLCITQGLFALETSDRPDWTWLLYKTFNAQELESNRSKLSLNFAKEDAPLFSQLIFSWNSIRPAKGYFTFYVQVRHSITKQWGALHKMMEWGHDVSNSYQSKSDGFSQYSYVRLEIENSNLSDAFHIKIQAHDGASFQLLKSFAVSLSNFQNFNEESVDQQIHALKSVYIRNVPVVSQFMVDHPKSDCICSPTSCSMLAGYLTQSYVDPADFANKSFDNGLNVHGSWPFNVAHAYEVTKGAFWLFTVRLNSFLRLHQRLVDGLPVVVSVRGPLNGAASAYKNGHLLVVVGWDAKKQEVICHDPAFKSEKEVVHRYPIKDFLIAWEKSRRLAYLAEQIH